MASRAPDKVPRATLAGSAALVAVPDHAPARRAPAVRLLIALTRPRPGFTTHVALARQIAVRAQDRLLWMESVAQELGDSGVDHDIFPTTCRGSRFAVKHGPRVGDQANRLTRQHGTSLRGEEIPAGATLRTEAGFVRLAGVKNRRAQGLWGTLPVGFRQLSRVLPPVAGASNRCRKRPVGRRTGHFAAGAPSATLSATRRESTVRRESPGEPSPDPVYHHSVPLEGKEADDTNLARRHQGRRPLW